ncbi:extracellular solute-binding protein [Acidisoma cellulosilytica]|uniref:Putrescine-binding periplasmic protein n=1 Tax=Acidisoma cellulosilyticum TaxID=2802395 RepID=A0A963YZV9_9PROT|nr:extracellular solute-binding protein [Acidisoma cellulosilyticum]MCB8880213.1 extracellular solute-binding protein [Acidisoma cellulosilyticum]
MNRFVRYALAALPVMLPLAPAAQAADPGVLHIYNWTDYTSPDLLKKFTKETGIKVTLDTYDSNETLLAKLKAGAGGYDLVIVSNDFVKIFIDQKLIQPVDAASMANFHYLDPRWQKRPWDATAAYTVPWQWGTTSFVYDTNVYPGPVDSMSTLFDPPAVFKGKIGMLGSPSEVINFALLDVGAEPCSSDPATLKKVMALLEAQKPFVKVYNSDAIDDRMISGETTMSMAYSGGAARMQARKSTIHYVYAKEGGIGWMDNLAVPVGAPDLENAKKFMNFMMDPQNAAVETEFAQYQNAVPDSNKYLPASITQAPQFNPPAGYKILFSPGCGVKATKDFDRIWTLLRN